MTPWAAVWLLVSPAVGSPPPYRSTLTEARVQITVQGDTASVIAWYRFTGTPDSLVFIAIRPRRQLLVFHGVAGAPSFRLDTLAGLYRLVARQTDSAPGLDVRYAVIGSLARIPLFVPTAPTDPGRSDVLIRVSGLKTAQVAAYAFPRFQPEPGDGWLARPDHLPSFIMLAASPASLPLPAMVQWTVVALVVLATTVWLVAQLRRRGST